MDLPAFIIMLFAIITGVAIAVVAMGMMNKDKKVSTKYDERQKIARGKSYAWGFYAMMISAAIFMLLSLLGLTKVFGGYSYFTILIIGCIVQVVHSIFNDAYIGLNNNPKKYMIFMSVVAAINACSAIAGFVNGEMIKDGVFQSAYLNLLCTLLFAAIAAAFGIKALIDKKDK